MSDNLTGQKFDKYVLHEMIGRGGMSTVYRASQPATGREVAIKVIAPALARHPAIAGRFEQEALAAARLQHPHILPVYDVGRAGEYFYIVMAYVPGRTLSRYIAANPGGLPLSEVVRLTNRIADALDHAHRRDIIHRDVKPGNVLLDARDHPYLADFGVAQLLGAVPDAAGPSFGTYAYMAPELADSRAASPASDIYALGVMVCEMLTGRRPYGVHDRDSFLRAHAESDLPDIRLWRPGLTYGMRVVVEQALHYDPAARPPRATSLAAALARAVGPEDPALGPVLAWDKNGEALEIALNDAEWLLPILELVGDEPDTKPLPENALPPPPAPNAHNVPTSTPLHTQADIHLSVPAPARANDPSRNRFLRILLVFTLLELLFLVLLANALSNAPQGMLPLLRL